MNVQWRPGGNSRKRKEKSAKRDKERNLIEEVNKRSLKTVEILSHLTAFLGTEPKSLLPELGW